MNSHTLPGEYAARLYRTLGVDPPSWKPPARVEAWAVVNDRPRRITVIRLRSASGCGEAADYADCADGNTVSTFYLFPVAKHCKPRLETLIDDFGPCRQWVAPLRPNVKARW